MELISNFVEAKHISPKFKFDIEHGHLKRHGVLLVLYLNEFEGEQNNLRKTRTSTSTQLDKYL